MRCLSNAPYTPAHCGLKQTVLKYLGKPPPFYIANHSLRYGVFHDSSICILYIYFFVLLYFLDKGNLEQSWLYLCQWLKRHYRAFRHFLFLFKRDDIYKGATMMVTVGLWKYCQTRLVQSCLHKKQELGALVSGSLGVSATARNFCIYV